MRTKLASVDPVDKHVEGNRTIFCEVRDLLNCFLESAVEHLVEEGNLATE